MNLQELESAVTQLPATELAAFAQWFEEYWADEWDRRIEADIQAGRLDKTAGLSNFGTGPRERR